MSDTEFTAEETKRIDDHFYEMEWSVDLGRGHAQTKAHRDEMCSHYTGRDKSGELIDGAVPARHSDAWLKARNISREFRHLPHEDLLAYRAGDAMFYKPTPNARATWVAAPGWQD